jgi:uncharacterized membrane protein YidH (DUF202 family)
MPERGCCHDATWPSVVERGLALLLAAAAGVSGPIAWYRWRQVERAIAEGRVAPPPRAHVVLVLVVGFVVGAVIVLTLID